MGLKLVVIIAIGVLLRTCGCNCCSCCVSVILRDSWSLAKCSGSIIWNWIWVLSCCSMRFNHSSGTSTRRCSTSGLGRIINPVSNVE
jgi:hypothetical protein